MFEFLSALLAVVICIGILCLHVYGPLANKPWIPSSFGGKEKWGMTKDIKPVKKAA